MNKTPKKPYTPPIAWERFDAMFGALHKRIFLDEPIDQPIAKELAKALHLLRAQYQKELAASFPNKRAKEQDLRDAAVACFLVDHFDADPVDAMEAATGQRSRVDRASLLRTLANRRTKLIGDIYFPGFSAIEAARKRLLAIELAREE